MIDKDTMITVVNRYNGRTGYTLEDDHIQRAFAPYEKRDIVMWELRHLANKPGGRLLLKEYLIIDNKEAAKELVGDVEPEYYYNEEDIRKVLMSGTINEFLDLLDFAPESVIEIAQDLAVKYEVPDTRKRDAIYEKTGFNVNRAIENMKIQKEAEAKEGLPTDTGEAKKPTRRASVSDSKENTVGRRRAEAPTTPTLNK